VRDAKGQQRFAVRSTKLQVGAFRTNSKRRGADSKTAAKAFALAAVEIMHPAKGA
jgi:hypothetical protein